MTPYRNLLLIFLNYAYLIKGVIRMDSKIVGKIIRNERKKQGLTQEQLAALSGMGRRLIIELESGERNSYLENVLIVLSTLGIKVNLVSRNGDEL